MSPCWNLHPAAPPWRPCRSCCGTCRTLRPATLAAVGCSGAARCGWPRRWHRRTRATTPWRTTRGRCCLAAPSQSAVRTDEMMSSSSSQVCRSVSCNIFVFVFCFVFAFPPWRPPFPFIPPFHLVFFMLIFLSVPACRNQAAPSMSPASPKSL